MENKEKKLKLIMFRLVVPYETKANNNFNHYLSKRIFVSRHNTVTYYLILNFLIFTNNGLIKKKDNKMVFKLNYLNNKNNKVWKFYIKLMEL